MTKITFDDPLIVRFITTVSKGMVSIVEETSLETADETDFALLERFRNRQASLLRYSRPGGPDVWMITGFDESELIRTGSRLKHLLTPSYGHFTPATPEIQRFHALSTHVKPLALSLALPGFYRLETDAQRRPDVLRTLRAWMQLEEIRPKVERVAQPTYRDAFASFQQALATSSWKDAKHYLDQIAKFRLTSADNIAFLEIRLLAAQEKWADIWESPRYPEWAKQRVPRQIRTALLTAYHHSELLPRETNGQWREALQHFRDTRFRLGRLLETRLQDHSTPVVRTFAYLAVASEDHQLAEGLRATLATETLSGIASILALMPPKQFAETPAVAPREEATTLLYVTADLDSARQVIPQIEESPVRATFLIDLADRTRDVFDAEQALNEVKALQTWERNDLLASKPYLQRRIATLKDMLGQQLVTDCPIDSWVKWLERAEADAPDIELESGLDFLLEQSDERMWEPAEARQISSTVQSIVLNPLLTARAAIKQGVETLADHLLLDSQFPRERHTYIEMYEAIYTFILETGRANEAESKRLLRYAEAILMDDPGRVIGISSQFQTWFSSPNKVLIDTHLDGLELLCDYGLDGRTLVGHVRQWAAAMLAFTSDLEESTLRAWAEFASSIDVGQDIVNALRKHEGVTEGSFAETVARLPERFRIAIFTLRPKSAERVRSMLLTMNPKLDIQISEEKDLSSRVKQLAATADLPVVVTTCITHALTYGIGPHLKAEPVRPDSSGSTSLVRAIELTLERVLENRR